MFVSCVLDPAQKYNTFRIPAICRTKRGTLLAFAEARESVQDQAANLLVLKRKERDKSRWSQLQVVQNDAPASLNNPCALATAEGRIWLMYQRYPAGLNESTVKVGTEPSSACTSYITWSDDDGISWHAPRNITDSVKTPKIQSDASGPGVGIELMHGAHRGRLLFPFNEGSQGKWTTFSVYSDDSGRTWKRGDPTPKTPGIQPNEVQFAECQDGAIYLNARNQASTKRRLTALSRDGGATWSQAQFDQNLEDPICQGSVIRLSDRPNLLAFSNPESETGRVNGVLKISGDNGISWIKAATINPGSFGYSCLVRLNDQKVGVLFESVESNPEGKEGYRIIYEEVGIGKP